MSRPVISVENLSKAYRIGLKEEVPDTLTSALIGFAKAPFRKFQQLSRLNTFRHTGEAEDIVWALKDVSFEVKEGEVLGVIGRNGAGKSTLLKVLSRITEPTSGRAIIRGRVSSLLEVGTGFHPELSGRENVYLNGTILGMTKAEIDKKFDEIVDFSGVEKFLDTPIKRYSSGMKVRLAFAVAAHLEPEILIIDEVLAVGDAEFQKKCMGKMQDVARGGRTVLFVSHNLGAMQNLCTEGILIEQGGLKANGPIYLVIDDYVTVLNGAPADSDFSSRMIQRSGSGEAYITHAEVYSVDGTASPTLNVGESFTVAVDVTSTCTLQNCCLSLTILDGQSRRFCVIDGGLSATGVQSLKQGVVNTFRCRIRDVNLVPGVYSIKMALQKLPSRAPIDVPRRWLSFKVAQDRFNDSESSHSAGAIVSFPADWSTATDRARPSLDTGHSLAACAAVTTSNAIQ